VEGIGPGQDLLDGERRRQRVDVSDAAFFGKESDPARRPSDPFA
jgi:hypothetical protein